MPTARSLPVAALLLAPLALLLVAPSSPDAPWLESGSPERVVLDANTDDFAVFRIRVPEGVTCMRLETRGANADVQLFASYEEAPDPTGYYGAASDSVWLDDELIVDVTDGYSLEPGVWYVGVYANEPWLPWSGEKPVKCEVVATLIEPERVPLPEERRVPLVLERALGLRKLVELPAGLGLAGPSVEVYCPTGDVDLVVTERDASPLLLEPALASAATTAGYERVDLDPADAEGGLLLHVFAWPANEDAKELAVELAVFDRESGESVLLPEPRVPDQPAGGLGHAAAATIAITGRFQGGSGVVVTPEGLVITNAHVVVEPRGYQGPLAPFAGGFSLDPSSPPEPAFGLEPIDVREDLDLALLRVVGRLDRRPLPDGFALPWLPLAPADAPPPALGDPVAVLGYPSTGGTSARVPLTASRGVLAGFALSSEGPLFKTDAEVHAGISGGPLIDAEGRVLAIAASSVSDENQSGGLGYAIPVSSLPEAWRTLIDRR